MKAISEETISAVPDQRRKASLRLLGRRRKDKARLILAINICAAVLMAVVGYIIN